MSELMSKEFSNGKKIKTNWAEIIVRGTSDKPYFEIAYFDLRDKEWHIGFGSYCLDYVFEWKRDCFEIVDQVAEEYGKDTNVRSNGWIPCSKELPKVYEDTKSSDVVLVCGYDKKRDYSWQAMGFYVHTEGIKRWFFAECKDTDKPIDWIDIVAWQPLPEPYEEKKND